MSKSVLLIGAGGHAKVLLEILLQLNCNIVGVIAPEKKSENIIFSGLKHFSNDDEIFTFDPAEILLVNGIGSLPGQTARFTIYEKLIAAGYRFMTVISPHAIVSKFAHLEEGVQVMPGAIINADAKIGANSIVNSGSIVEHDCVVGVHNHLAPGVTLSGGVITGAFVHVGTGANVIQAINIGNSVMVAAGASVTKDLTAGTKLYGAKPYSVTEENRK